MPAAIRPNKQIDALMEKASQALAETSYFKAERLADQALKLARASEDFERMGRIILPLQEARRQRLQQSVDVGTITVICQPRPEDHVPEPGCYVVSPPQVGADARRLRLAALHHGVPVAVMCREPLTQLELCPVVAIAPGVTVRTKIEPPGDPDAPDLEWFAMAMEALGDFAIITVDAGLAVQKRLDMMMLRLDAIPEHEGLHQALAECCREAELEAQAETGPRARSRKAARGRTSPDP